MAIVLKCLDIKGRKNNFQDDDYQYTYYIELLQSLSVTDLGYEVLWCGWDSASVQVCTSLQLSSAVADVSNSLRVAAHRSNDLDTMLLAWREVQPLLCTSFDGCTTLRGYRGCYDMLGQSEES